jgi:phosphohistidine phosphatase
MKRIFIVRHGKSSWELDSVDDIDRPLNNRGISDGYKMSARLIKLKQIPELLISSNAVRALHTASIFHRELNMSADLLKIDPSLYLAGVGTILDVIYSVDDKWESLMIFGHNPGFTEISNYLSNLNISNVPTTGLVTLDFDTDKWTEVDRSLLVGENFDFPRKK